MIACWCRVPVVWLVWRVGGGLRRLAHSGWELGWAQESRPCRRRMVE